MTGPRPRIDLDGVPLLDPEQPHSVILAVFRLRTRDGLLVLMPESGEVTVPWSAVEKAEIDLIAGQLSIQFSDDYVKQETWLRGARRVRGQWLDRITL